MHEELANLDSMEQGSIVHCVGDMMRGLYEALPEAKRGMWCATTEDMAPQVPKLLDAGDVVMAKGSLSMDLKRIVDAIRKMGHSAPNDPEQGT